MFIAIIHASFSGYAIKNIKKGHKRAPAFSGL